MSFRTNSQWMPAGFPHHFDAHIYFSLEQLEFAKELREKISKNFQGSSFHVGDDLYDHTQAAIWLGQPVPLKLEMFAK